MVQLLCSMVGGGRESSGFRHFTGVKLTNYRHTRKSEKYSSCSKFCVSIHYCYNFWCPPLKRFLVYMAYAPGYLSKVCFTPEIYSSRILSKTTTMGNSYRNYLSKALKPFSASNLCNIIQYIVPIYNII